MHNPLDVIKHSNFQPVARKGSEAVNFFWGAKTASANNSGFCACGSVSLQMTLTVANTSDCYAFFRMPSICTRLSADIYILATSIAANNSDCCAKFLVLMFSIRNLLLTNATDWGQQILTYVCRQTLMLPSIKIWVRRDRYWHSASTIDRVVRVGNEGSDDPERNAID